MAATTAMIMAVVTAMAVTTAMKMAKIGSVASDFRNKAFKVRPLRINELL